MKTKIINIKSGVSALLEKYIKNFKEINLSKIFIILFCIFLTYIISEKVLLPFNFYLEYKWLDIPMHIIGAFLFTKLFLEIINSKYINFKTVLFFILFIGIGWEVLEYIKDITNLKSFVGWTDTFKDIFNDVFGAYLAFALNKKK
jgi:hypothetical protein